ncbi:MAG: endo-1,4-beta-xylanase [Candidatus Hydrogenedentota bacterium]
MRSFSVNIGAFLFPFSVAVIALLTTGTVRADEPAKFLGSIWQNSADDPLFGTLFDQITPENCGKWDAIERERRERVWTNMDAMVQFADRHSMIVKHHCLVWGQQQPAWTQEADDISNAVDALIADFFERYGKTITLVDVINEPISAPPAYRSQLGGDGKSGWDWVIWTFRRARLHGNTHGFTGKLILNEWGIERNQRKLKQFREIVSILQQESLIDAIGVQGHYLEIADAAKVRQSLDYLAETGLPIYISEFELDIADDIRHEQQFMALFSMFWEHPAVRGVTLWGHREGQMWRKNGYLIRKDGSERPAMTWLRHYMASYRKTHAANKAPEDTTRVLADPQADVAP